MTSSHQLRLGSGRIHLRAPAAGDHSLLVQFWRTPEVARWWPNMDAEELRALLDDPGIIPFVIEVEGSVGGFLQVWEEEDPDYRHAGMDLMLAPDFAGRGIGPEAIRLVARWLFGERGHHRITIDPALDNIRARRAYEKVGFRPVGVMRAYERRPDGEGWRDGMLYDLLAEDLT